MIPPRETVPAQKYYVVYINAEYLPASQLAADRYFSIYNHILMITERSQHHSCLAELSAKDKGMHHEQALVFLAFSRAMLNT